MFKKVFFIIFGGIILLIIFQDLFWVVAILILFIVFLRKIRKREIEKTNCTMNSWLNHNKNELLASWGPPTSVFPIDSGGEIWSYHYMEQTPGYAHKSSSDYIYIYGPRQYTIKREFFIDQNGIIFNYRWENM